jgi:hypothetical protein
MRVILRQLIQVVPTREPGVAPWQTVRMPGRKSTRPTPAHGADDPNKLVRQRAGLYRTADERFEVRQAALGWFLVDSAATNEFGQELVRGPFATLDALREMLPEARRTTLASVPAARRRSSAKATGKTGAKAGAQEKRKPAPPPPPRSWLDELPRPRAAAARRLLAAAEREGLNDAESLVRDAIEGRGPGLAAPVIERRLQQIVDKAPAEERETARRMVVATVELLTGAGARVPDPLPGWSLVEIGEQPAPPNRRLRPKTP